MANRIDLITMGRKSEDAKAHAALSPGHLLERLSTGKYQKHSTSAGRAEMVFALEDALQGKTIDDAYAADDILNLLHALPGDVVQARVPAAAAALVVGDYVMSNGDGTVIKATAIPSVAIATVEEAVDNSAGGSEAFCVVRVL